MYFFFSIYHYLVNKDVYNLFSSLLYYNELEKVATANCEALQLEGRPTSRLSFRFFKNEIHNAPAYKFNTFATSSATPISSQVWIFWRLVGICHFWSRLLQMSRNCYFRASIQNSDIAVRLSDSDFLKGNNHSADDVFRCFIISLYISKNAIYFYRGFVLYICFEI